MAFKAGTARKRGVVDVAHKRKKKLTSLSKHCLYRGYDTLEPFELVLKHERLSLNPVPQPKPLLVPKSDVRPAAGAWSSFVSSPGSTDQNPRVCAKTDVRSMAV
jgi:hypothetical protein